MIGKAGSLNQLCSPTDRMEPCGHVYAVLVVDVCGEARDGVENCFLSYHQYSLTR